MSAPLDQLEQLLGYKFRDQQLLKLAMLHPSMRFGGRAGVEASNQRLEFLGDAVVQLVISETIYHRLQNQAEGLLTKLRSNVVSEYALARIARQLDMGKFLILARSELANGGRDRDSILADAVEALFGALYLDGGLPAAQDVASRLFSDTIDDRQSQVFVDDGNPKGQLQELTQRINGTLPIYNVTESTGPEHAKFFRVVVEWNGASIGEGSGPNKRVAQARAAREALRHSSLQVKPESAGA